MSNKIHLTCTKIILVQYSYWELACRKTFKHFWATFYRRLTDIFNRKIGINISLLHFHIRDWRKLKEFTRLCQTCARIKNYLFFWIGLNFPITVLQKTFVCNWHSCLKNVSHTFLASILVASRTIHIIPHVCMAWSKGVNTVFFSKVVWLILSPVAEFKRTSIHPSEHSFSGNIIQTNPRLITVVSVLNIDVFFLAFNGRQISSHWSAD